MNYTELQAAILGDTQRSDYAPHIERFIAQAEALISLQLDAFPLAATLTDTDRGSDFESAIYTLPAHLSQVRYVSYNSTPLVLTDETTISYYRESNGVGFYSVRGPTLVVAGVPPELAELELQYMGTPEPLETTPENALLTEYPQLYIDAASVYVFRRARNFEAAQIALQSFDGAIKELNRKIKKKLGGAQSANPYNVNTRSSY